MLLMRTILSWSSKRLTSSNVPFGVPAKAVVKGYSINVHTLGDRHGFFQEGCISVFFILCKSAANHRPLETEAHPQRMGVSNDLKTIIRKHNSVMLSHALLFFQSINTKEIELKVTDLSSVDEIKEGRLSKEEITDA